MKKRHVCFLTLFLLHFVLLLLTHNRAMANDRLVSSTSKEFSTGLNSRIVSLIANQLDLDLEIVYVSFARKLVLMEEGKVDISAALHKTESREKYIYYIDPPYSRHSKKCFFVPKDGGVSIDSYENLHGLRIGTSINVKYFDRFDTDLTLNKVRVSKTDQKFKMLLLGRVDTVIHGYGGALRNLKEHGILDQVEIANYFFHDENPVYIGISKQSLMYERIEEIEPVIRQLIKDGKVQRLIDEYYSDLSTF